MATNLHQLSKESVLAILLRKKRCNDRALATVESLLDIHLKEIDFLNKLLDINQCHFEDVINERHILHLCAYPLCDKTIEKTTSQQYKISTSTNKVYKITERKKYCSTTCFRASEYIKSQLLTSPLWLRHQEVIPTFHLLK